MNAVTLKLWYQRLTVDHANYQRHWDALDAEEKSHAASIKNESRHKRYVAVHGLLRYILSQTVNEPPQQLKISKTRHGKPYLVDFPELSFNLSHTADTMVVAIGPNCQLGADIETCKSRTSLPSLVERCFADVEAAWWRKLPEAEKTREFYRFWTRKEAFVKATGRGIALGMNRCILNPENPAAFLNIPESCGPASIWHARDIDLGQDVCTALVADQAIADVVLISS